MQSHEIEHYLTEIGAGLFDSAGRGSGTIACVRLYLFDRGVHWSSHHHICMRLVEKEMLRKFQ